MPSVGAQPVQVGPGKRAEEVNPVSECKGLWSAEPAQQALLRNGGDVEFQVGRTIGCLGGRGRPTLAAESALAAREDRPLLGPQHAGIEGRSSASMRTK